MSTENKEKAKADPKVRKTREIKAESVKTENLKAEPINEKTEEEKHKDAVLYIGAVTSAFLGAGFSVTEGSVDIMLLIISKINETQGKLTVTDLTQFRSRVNSLRNGK